jgi:hypothetical protein
MGVSHGRALTGLRAGQARRFTRFLFVARLLPKSAAAIGDHPLAPASIAAYLANVYPSTKDWTIFCQLKDIRVNSEQP